MCGIIGYIGKDKKAIEKTISCLEKLEYRGYDSSGIAYVNNNKVNIEKETGRIIKLKNKLDYNIEANIAIAHTRWATHGEANTINAHPHKVGKFTIVHNGIIENYIELKEKLISNGYVFKSQTDTEVACATLDYYYNKTNNILDTLNKFKEVVRGSYALGIIEDDDLDTLYALKKDSPLILGIADNNYFIASDIPAILEYTDKYILIDDGEIIKLDDNYTIYKDGRKINKEIKIFNFKFSTQDKGNFEHFMLKEINEQPNIIYNLLNENLNNNLADIPSLSGYDRIDIIGCGSAYHTSLVSKYLFEDYADIEVNCHVASEYRYQKNFYGKNSLVIFISQSGETADTLACLRKVKGKGIDTLAIVNAEGSSIAREADNVIYIKAGQEIAVATTKAYTAQITILSLLALKAAIEKNNIDNLNQIKEEANNIIVTLDNIIKNNNYKKIAETIYKHNDIFFIGRLVDYALALEGSLKLKEISYINSATYPAGELKHGTISLIEKDTPVITLITNQNIKEKTISNIKEIKARGAYSIVITNEEIDSEIYDNLIIIPKVNDFLQPIIAIIPLQIIAYYVAKNRGCDIDKPRNLAKSVTVE